MGQGGDGRRGAGESLCGKDADPFTFSTNGQGIYGIDMETGVEGEVPRYPTPDELWNLTFAKQDRWRDYFAAIPFEDRGGYFQGRYYQDIAIERVLEAIAAGDFRILLTLATGTGKTFIAFQIAWKLFQSRWNLSASRPAARASCFSPTGTSSPTKPTTRFPLFRKMRSSASLRMRSARRAGCRRTAASSSRSSRPS